MKKQMKKLLYILLMVVGCANYALPQNPYYYDDCWNNSIPFAFPLERVISDTVWYTATLDDVKKGISASWYSNVSVTMEVYAFCTSKTPSFTLTVEPNQLREMEIEVINKKLEAMGEMAQMMAQTLTPHIRIYPNKNSAGQGQGTVYCYPYDQGPISTCEKMLPLFENKTTVCSAPHNVYELVPSRMSSYGRGFIVWKQKKNQPGTIYVTKDSCNGPEIGRSVLKDSIYVMVLDSNEVKAAKKANKSLYVHVEHPDDYVGRIIYHNRIVRNSQFIDTTLCQGIRLKLRDTTLVESTIYTKDTVWTAGDTLSWTTYKVTVTPPPPHYDTLLLSASQLPKSYKGKYIPKDGWGDYEILEHKTNQCDNLWYVHVQHQFTTHHGTIDTTLCQGREYKYGTHIYLADTTAVDSAWITPDLWSVDTIKLTFTAPQQEFDTVTVAPSQMAAGYQYKPYNIVITEYGDTLLSVSQKGQCDRLILLTVLQGEDITTAMEYLMDDQRSAGKYLRNGMLFIRRNGNDYDIYGRKINH